MLVLNEREVWTVVLLKAYWFPNIKKYNLNRRYTRLRF